MRDGSAPGPTPGADAAPVDHRLVSGTSLKEDDISDHTIEGRLVQLEAHAFRTDCRLRDLEALVGELTTDAPAALGERLDRIETALAKLRQWKTLLPKLEYEKAKSAAGADGLTVAEWVSRAILEQARQEAIREAQRGGARMEAVPLAPPLHRALTEQADAQMLKPWALAARYIQDGVDAARGADPSN